MSDDWINAKTLQVIAEYSLMDDTVTLDGVTYVCRETSSWYYEENATRLERERIITMLQQMNHECQCAIRGPERDRVIALIRGDVDERRQSQMSEYGDKGENK